MSKKKYHVLMSESLAKTIEIEAESAEEAEKLVNEGNWYDEWVVKEDVIDRMVVESEVFEPIKDIRELL